MQQGAKTKEGDKLLYKLLPHVLKQLERATIPWVQLRKYEADDVLGACASQASPSLKVVLGTKDKDSYQLLNENVRLLISDAKPAPVYMTAKKAEKIKGVPIDRMVDYQTILGDSGDDVPGIPKYGPDTVAKIIRKYNTISEWLDAEDKAGNTKLLKYKSQLLLNRKLVRLVTDCYEMDLKSMVIDKVTDRSGLPKSFSAYVDWRYPKTKGLF